MTPAFKGFRRAVGVKIMGTCGLEILAERKKKKDDKTLRTASCRRPEGLSENALSHKLLFSLSVCLFLSLFLNIHKSHLRRLRSTSLLPDSGLGVLGVNNPHSPCKPYLDDSHAEAGLP